MRVRANFAEYVAYTIILIFMLELSGAFPWLAYGLCLSLTLGHLSYAYDVSQMQENFRPHFWNGHGFHRAIWGSVGHVSCLCMARSNSDWRIMRFLSASHHASHASLKLTVLFATLFIPACSFFDVVNAFNPNSLSSVQRDVAYGALARNKLDIYSPLEPAPNAAIVVFFYGGGWDSGKRADYEFVARKIAAMGHFAVIPDYRLYPQVVFPGFVQDGALATAYVLEHAYHITGRNSSVFLMGHSAGAHIAMLVALDDRYLAETGHTTSQLAGAIGLAGPYDFLPLTSARLQKIFPTLQARYDSQPINFVDANDPPVFLGHGNRDKRVLLKNSVNMAEAIMRKGNAVTLRIYPGLSHTGVVRPFISFMNDDKGVLSGISLFLSGS